MSMNRLLVSVMLAVGMSWCLPGLFECVVPQPNIIASAEETWKKEFDEICAGTDDPMRLSTEELKGLIRRCDTLEKVIEGLDASTRKVYLKRINMCRDLYRYVLSVREAETKE
jgi:hypothetical protein